MGLYELAVMGAPSNGRVEELRGHISRLIESFGLQLGKEVAWSVLANAFQPDQMVPAAVAFFGGEGVSVAGLNPLLRAGVPILPIASQDDRVSAEIPPELRVLTV